MSGEEGDLALQWVPAALRLALGLRRADQDVADVEPSVGVALKFFYGPFTFRSSDGLTERENIGRPVLLAITTIQRSHRCVVDERDGDAGICGEGVWLDGRADRAPDRDEIARRLAEDGESQRPDASGGGVAAGGTREMRSSGYGIRS